MSENLEQLLNNIRSCRACEVNLPLGPRPVLRAHENAKILLVGQAPGTRVHETGIPWNDPSGDRIRNWMNIDRQAFYNEEKIAIIPMGLCYPGKGKSGDLPPRRECADLWFKSLHKHLKNIELTIVIGQYAQAYYLGNRRKKTLTETVRSWKEYLPDYLPLVHPSPRNVYWLQKNPWFETEVVPALREHVKKLL